MSDRRKFGLANPEEIKAGRVTDVYFERAKEILNAKSQDASVAFEALVKRMELDGWGIFCGLDSVLDLLEGLPIDLWALPEGSMFYEREPVLLIRGQYRELSTYQTAIMGFICQTSGVASSAARSVISAAGRPVYSFGARGMHPGIAPAIERAAYIGGCAGVSSSIAAAELGIEPVGTLPHGLVLIMGDSASAMLAFDEVIDKKINRVAIVDTFGDEKFEALENAELLDTNIYAVRLETPSSRRGDMLEIAREVRWELSTRGFDDIKILISGGVDEDNIPELNEVADEYGVDTPISNAPVIKFSLGVVEVNGEAIAKRGTESGAKQLYVCTECKTRFVTLFSEDQMNCPTCNAAAIPQLAKLLDQGRVVTESQSPKVIRDFVLKQLELP